MDLVGRDDLDEFASETEDEDELLEQDLGHRLLEDYGSNPDDEDRGVGLLSRLSGSDPPSMIARLIEADWTKDPRVLTCVVEVTRGGGDASGVAAHVNAEVTTSSRSLTLGYDVGADGTLSGGIVR